MTGFPLIYGKIRQVFHVPFTKLYVFGIVHGNFASTFLVTEQIVHFSIVHHHPGTRHGNHLGSSPFERERGLAFGNLSVVPVHTIVPNDAVLGNITIGIAPVGSDVRMTSGIRTHTGLVYQFGILRNTAGIFGIAQADRKLILLSVGLIPGFTSVKRTGVA